MLNLCECNTVDQTIERIKQIREVFKLIDTDIFKWFNNLSYTEGFDTVVSDCYVDYNHKTQRRQK